jgi:hypothetical protein
MLLLLGSEAVHLPYSIFCCHVCCVSEVRLVVASLRAARSLSSVLRSLYDPRATEFSPETFRSLGCADIMCLCQFCLFEMLLTSQAHSSSLVEYTRSPVLRV